VQTDSLQKQEVGQSRTLGAVPDITLGVDLFSQSASLNPDHCVPREPRSFALPVKSDPRQALIIIHRFGRSPAGWWKHLCPSVGYVLTALFSVPFRRMG